MKIFERKKTEGVVTIRAYKAGTKILLQEIKQKNTIMKAANVGMDLIIQRLCSVNTYTLNVNYGAIGTGSTTPAVTDTKLTTETARTLITPNQQDVGYSEAKLQFFFPDANLANGTYHEFGAFIDGTALADSGKILNHALFSSAFVKTSGIDTVVEVDISLS